MQNYSASQLTPQQAARALLDRRAARSSVEGFTRFTMPEYSVNWHHKLLAEHLDRIASGELKRLLVCMPPRHGKSELVSRRFPAYMMGRNPDLKIIACSYASTLAVDMCRATQKIIDTDRYRAAFPGTRLSGRNVVAATSKAKRTADEFEVIDHNGGYFCTGTGGGVTGKGFSLGLADDLIKGAEQADSPTYREKVWRWWNTEFLSRAAPDAAIVMCATRWHRDDVIGRELHERGDEWTVLSLPWIAGHTTPSYDPRAEGEALWPEFKPASEVESVKVDTRTFFALYQQDPRTEGGNEWPDDCFADSIYTDGEWPHTVKAVSLDPSKGKQAKKGDYSAIICVGVTDDLVYVDADLARRNPTKIVADLFAFCEKHRPQYLGLESNQFQSLFVDLIRGYAEKRPELWLSKWLELGNPIIELDNRENKEYRIRRLSQYITGRTLRYNRTPGNRMLVDQLRDFPNADHDDGPDALEMAMRIFAEANGMQTAETLAGTLI